MSKRLTQRLQDRFLKMLDKIEYEGLNNYFLNSEEYEEWQNTLFDDIYRAAQNYIQAETTLEAVIEEKKLFLGIEE